MEQEFIDILKKLVAEQGNAALTEARKCKALLADYTKNEFKKESRLLVQAVEAGVAKIIEGAGELEPCKKAQIRDLEEEHGLSPTFAENVVNALALVLRGDTTVTVSPSTERAAAEKAAAEKVAAEKASAEKAAAEKASAERAAAERAAAEKASAERAAAERAAAERASAERAAAERAAAERAAAQRAANNTSSSSSSSSSSVHYTAFEKSAFAEFLANLGFEDAPYGLGLNTFMSIFLGIVFTVGATLLAHTFFPALPLWPSIVFFVIAFASLRFTHKVLIVIFSIVAAIGIGVTIYGAVKSPSKLKDDVIAVETPVINATVTSNSANFRSGPSTSSSVIKTLKKGDILIVNGDTADGWVLVKHGDDIGYISADLISIGGATATTTTTTTTTTATTSAATPLDNTGGQTETATGGVAQAATQAVVGGTTTATTALREGTYYIRPRIQAKQSGRPQNLYLDRIEVQGKNFSVYMTGAPEGKGGDGHYQPFWYNLPLVKLESLDRAGQTYSVTGADEDDNPNNPKATNGFYNTFQGVSGTRFKLTSNAMDPPWVFEDIVLGEPVR